MHDVLAVDDAEVPLGHGVQEPAPTPENVPAAQSKQSALPIASTYVPAAHCAQLALPGALACAPIAHGMHEVDASDEANVPGGQSLHTESPATSA